MFKVAIVGRPNVGKSTFFNRVIGKNKSITSDIAGTTRDNVISVVTWNDVQFELTDMGGLDTGLRDEMASAVMAHIKNQIKRFDLILFMGDAKTGITHVDIDNFKLVRKHNIPAWLLINKADNEKLIEESNDFYRLGFKHVFFISSTQGTNVADVLDAITKQCKGHEIIEQDQQKKINIAILGRPNVGKSSIVNALVGEETVLVSEIAGTTRDAVDSDITYKDQLFTLIDTAGIRRPGKIEPSSLEHFSIMRADYAISRCDIAVMVIDSSEGITHQDQNIISIILGYKKGLIIVANKWDLVNKKEVTKEGFIYYAQNKLDYLSWATFIFTEAIHKKNVHEILNQALIIRAKQNTFVSEQDCAFWLKKVLHNHPMIGSFHGKNTKVYKMHQVATDPPHFECIVNEPKGLHFSARRYFENELRKDFDLNGVAVKFTFKKKR